MDDVSRKLDEPFHAGEVAVQERLGMAQRMREIGRRTVRPFMTAQHQQFFGQLAMVLVGSVDARGRPWASVLVGRPGFLHAPDAGHLDVQAMATPGDPLADGLRVGSPLGFLGIELHSRRRNRTNGHVVSRDSQGFRVQVDQTVGNCPKYIQGRELHWVREADDLSLRAVEVLDRLDDEACRFIVQVDTLFVATHAPAAEGQAARGADVSHRGGRAGFVRVENSHSFLVPDFSGNFFFMTLGNLQLNPRAGVLFIDFSTGDLLLLTGTAEVIWDAEALKGFDGAERAWRFQVESGLRLRDALPMRFGFRDWSRHVLNTGTWDEAAARMAARMATKTHGRT